MKKAKFTFKDIDVEGLETLENIACAENFNRHIYRVVSHFCEGKTLEIGSGIGNISQHFLIDKKDIELSDVRENYCDFLRKKFADQNPLIHLIDLVNPDFEQEYSDLLRNFDSVFALNVVEHIENDSLALQNCYKLLKPGGRLIILVPAFQSLYNEFDKELFHYRRYTQKQLVELFEKSDFKVVNKFYFNVLGILGWFFSGTVLKKKIIPKGQMKVYDALLPFTKYLDYIVLKKVGLSVVVVGLKK